MSATSQSLHSQAKVGATGKAALLQKHDDDVVVVAALRTAVTKVSSHAFVVLVAAKT